MELARLSFVTGKGGTGKSTLCAALALAVARDKPSILADLDGRLSAARLLGICETSSNGDIGGDKVRIDSIAVTGRSELEAFVGRFVPLKSISRRMLQSRTLGYVGAAVPGLSAFLMMERLRLIAGEAALNDRYAVVDAPSSGSALELLGVAAGVREMAPLGTLNRLASGIEGLLADPNRFGVIVTLSPEEPAVHEAIEIARRMRESGVARVSAVLNYAVDDLFDNREMARVRGLAGHEELVLRRRAMAVRTAGARRALEHERLDFIELPRLFRTSLGRRDVTTLAASLGEVISRP